MLPGMYKQKHDCNWLYNLHACKLSIVFYPRIGPFSDISYAYPVATESVPSFF